MIVAIVSLGRMRSVPLEKKGSPQTAKHSPVRLRVQNSWDCVELARYVLGNSYAANTQHGEDS